MEHNKKEFIINEVVSEVDTKPKPKRKRKKNKNKNKNKIVKPETENKQNENKYFCRYCEFFMEEKDCDQPMSRKEYLKHIKTEEHKSRLSILTNRESNFQKLMCLYKCDKGYKPAKKEMRQSMIEQKNNEDIFVQK